MPQKEEPQSSVDHSPKPEEIEFLLLQIMASELVDNESALSAILKLEQFFNERHSKQGGRKPTRLLKILEVFRGTSRKAVPLDHLAPDFEQASDPRSAVATAIWNINHILKEMGESIEIKSSLVYYIGKRHDSVDDVTT